MAERVPDGWGRAVGLAVQGGSFRPRRLQTPSWAGGTCKTFPPAPAAGKGTSGHAGPFAALKLEKVLGGGRVWQWDRTGLTGEPFPALHQGRRKTKVLMVLNALTVIFRYYSTSPQAQRSERGQLGQLLCSDTASATH